MQKLPLKEKCLTATANYHPGIRYIMTEYNAKYIFIYLCALQIAFIPAFEGDGGHRFGKQKSLPLIDPVLG